MKDRQHQQKDNKRRVARGDVEPADWSGVDGKLLAYAVAVVARQGGAIRLGYTRDGGAYAVGIYGDGEPYTDYIRPSEDVEQYLRGVIAVWDV